MCVVFQRLSCVQEYIGHGRSCGLEVGSGMELSKFLLLFTTTNMFLASKGEIQTMADPMLIDSALTDLLSDMPWAPIFFIICTAVLATMTSSPQHQDEWLIPGQSTLWRRLNKRVGVLNPMMQEKQWIKHCRMSYPAFVYLVEELRPYMLPNAQMVREPVELELAVAIVLNRLASGASPAVIGNLWGVGTATVVKYTKLVTSIFASCEKLYSKYIVAPTGERLERISKKFFQVTGIPNVAGAIDGTHIVLQKKPDRATCPADFCSGEGKDAFYSVLLQGVCDADKVFWDVCCVAPGGSNDSEHLKSSSLWTRLWEKEVLREPVISLQGVSIRPYLVGDKNYPLLPFLINPFDTAPAETQAESLFDAQLQKGHASIVTTFGILKNRWNILKNLNVDLKSAPQTIVACCVLHNFCQLSNQSEPKIQVDDALNHNVPDHYSDDVGGEETRQALFLNWLTQHQILI